MRNPLAALALVELPHQQHGLLPPRVDLRRRELLLRRGRQRQGTLLPAELLDQVGRGRELPGVDALGGFGLELARPDQVAGRRWRLGVLGGLLLGLADVGYRAPGDGATGVGLRTTRQHGHEKEPHVAMDCFHHALSLPRNSFVEHRPSSAVAIAPRPRTTPHTKGPTAGRQHSTAGMSWRNQRPNGPGCSLPAAARLALPRRHRRRRPPDSLRQLRRPVRPFGLRHPIGYPRNSAAIAIAQARASPQGTR